MQQSAMQEAPMADSPRSPFYFPRRYIICLLLFFLVTVCYLDRVNMAIAIIPMRTQFNWSGSTQGLVLGAFFWGYVVPQIPSRLLIRAFGPKKVLLGGALGFSLATIGTAVVANYVPLIIFSRVLLGLCEGVTYTSVVALLAAWSPWQERTRLVGLVFSGNVIGTSISTLVAPPIIRVFGWPAVFYFYGCLGFLWSFMWQFLSADRPSQHAFIATHEREFIDGNLHSAQELRRTTGPYLELEELPASPPLEETLAAEPIVEMEEERAPHELLPRRPSSIEMHQLGEPDPGSPAKLARRSAALPAEVYAIPWRTFFASTACWAIFVAHFCYNWGLYFFITWLPTYFHDELQVELEHLGWVSVVPWLLSWLVQNLCAWISDWLRRRGWPTARVRKMMQCSGFVIPAALMLMLVNTSSSFWGLVLLVLAMAVNGAGSTFTVGPIDVAPKYADILFGISNTFATIPGMVGVPLVGVILHVTKSWQVVFFIQIAIWCAGALFYAFFCEGHVSIS